MFPRIQGTFLGIPVIRIQSFGGLYWGPLFQETPFEEDLNPKPYEISGDAAGSILLCYLPC